MIDGAGKLDDDDISPFSSDIPLNSRYGQAVLATIYGLSIEAIMKLLKAQPKSRNTFSCPDGSVIGREELVMICLAWEVADELFSCTGEAHRMEQFHNDIIRNIDAYFECGLIILRGLKLIEEECHKRRSAGLKHFRVMHGHGKIADVSRNIQKALVEAGVSNKCKLEKMLSLEQLQDRCRVHRCHQYFVKDEKWNLVDTSNNIDDDYVTIH